MLGRISFKRQSSGEIRLSGIDYGVPLTVKHRNERSGYEVWHARSHSESSRYPFKREIAQSVYILVRVQEESGDTHPGVAVILEEHYPGKGWRGCLEGMKSSCERGDRIALCDLCKSDRKCARRIEHDPLIYNPDQFILEVAKVGTANEVAQTAGTFLDWLREEKGLALCKYEEWSHRLVAVTDSTESLLYEFCDIDPRKVEQEKQWMLDAIRRKNEAEGMVIGE